MRLILAALLAFTPSMASAQTNEEKLQDLRARIEARRAAEIQDEGKPAQARYLLTDYAKAQGYLDYCRRGQTMPDFERLAERYSEWAKPNSGAWWSGEQKKAVSSLSSHAKLAYLSVEFSADCDPLLMLSKGAVARIRLREFESLLLSPIE